MISLRDGMPLITMPTGQASSFDKRWVTAAIQSAAQTAGYKHWRLADHITESVSLFLREEIQSCSFQVMELEKVLSDLLISLGYANIAKQFSLPDPPATLSLMELAEKAGTSYELLFFELLKKRLQHIAASSTTRLEIYDLEPCLYHLTHRRHVGRAKKLRAEIISCIRHYGSSQKHALISRNQRPLEIAFI
ncbi:MAG: hypothetical protein ACH346_04495 [Chthoniobacterales bacterium]